MPSTHSLQPPKHLITCHEFTGLRISISVLRQVLVWLVGCIELHTIAIAGQSRGDCWFLDEEVGL